MRRSGAHAAVWLRVHTLEQGLGWALGEQVLAGCLLHAGHCWRLGYDRREERQGPSTDDPLILRRET